MFEAKQSFFDELLDEMTMNAACLRPVMRLVRLSQGNGSFVVILDDGGGACGHVHLPQQMKKPLTLAKARADGGAFRLGGREGHKALWTSAPEDHR